MSTTPHHVDLHVGDLRQRRRLKGISQAMLAARLDLTFQQLQKYERGANRISASKLHMAAVALPTPVAWFFEGLPQTVRRPLDKRQIQTDRFLDCAEGPALARLVPAPIGCSPPPVAGADPRARRTR